jgi:hypothetical protein
MSTHPKFTFEYILVTHHFVQADTATDAPEELNFRTLDEGDFMHVDVSAVWDEVAEAFSGVAQTIYQNPEISIEKRRVIELPRGVSRMQWPSPTERCTHPEQLEPENSKWFQPQSPKNLLEWEKPRCIDVFCSLQPLRMQRQSK